jgi:hypothetical protein
VGTAFVLNITGATGARGWITWEASRTDQVVPPNYSATVLADRPVGYWRLGDPVGAVTALDSSGNGRTGTVLGGVTFGQAGAVDGNTAALFDGTTGYITSTAPIPANCTIEAWVNPSTVGPGGSYYRILSSGNNFPFEIAIGSDQGIWFFVNFVGLTPGWMLGSPGLPLPLNTWTYVAMTWDGTTLRVFVNGTQTYANAAWAGKVLQSGTVFIGSVIGGSGSFWIGKLDDVALYATALSPERIAQHYREGLAR